MWLFLLVNFLALPNSTAIGVPEKHCALAAPSSLRQICSMQANNE